MSQNKHVFLESNDYRPGKSYLADNLYARIPGTKNRFAYSELQKLYNSNKLTMKFEKITVTDGTLKTVRALITTDRIVGFIINKDGTINPTNQLTVHYKKSGKTQGDYHFVPKLNITRLGD